MNQKRNTLNLTFWTLTAFQYGLIMTKRFAVYFSPKADSELDKFGKNVLGRTAESARAPTANTSFVDSSRWKQITERPAHYGFHATLKAPFELSEAHTAAQLLAAVESFSTNFYPVSLNTLAPRNMAGFIALTLAEQSQSLTQFAFSCVEQFETFRKPLSEADTKRRQQQSLTPRQESLLQEFGYPYVADEFRFHMTLSGKLEAQDDDYQHWVLEQYAACVKNTPELNQLAVYTQDDRKSAFTQLAVFPLKQKD